MKPERDFFWSDLFVEMQTNEVQNQLDLESPEDIGIEWMDSEDIIFHAISKM